MKFKKETNPAPQQETEEIQVIQEESKGRQILNTVVNALLVLAIALAAVCTYVSFVSTSGNGVPSIFGIRIFSIQTESMYPTLLPGDLIFDTGVKDASDLRKGDVITYWTVINGERVLNTHRIYEVYDGGGYLIFSTKGDNNTVEDALTVHESEIVGKYAFRVEGLGKVFDYLQTSTGFLIVVVIPVFLFFLFHLVQFFRVLFEYQNVKNRIKYEQERGATEDMIARHEQQQKAQAEARAKMEAELRERLRAEILESMAAQKTEPAQPEEPAAPAEPEQPEPQPQEPEQPAQEPEPQPQEPEQPAQEPEPQQEPEDSQETAPAEQPAAPVVDEAAIEAMIARQREAFEAQLREKLRAELLANGQTGTREEKNEETAEETSEA